MTTFRTFYLPPLPQRSNRELDCSLSLSSPNTHPSRTRKWAKGNLPGKCCFLQTFSGQREGEGSRSLDQILKKEAQAQNQISDLLLPVSSPHICYGVVRAPGGGEASGNRVVRSSPPISPPRRPADGGRRR